MLPATLYVLEFQLSVVVIVVTHSRSQCRSDCPQFENLGTLGISECPGFHRDNVCCLVFVQYDFLFPPLKCSVSDTTTVWLLRSWKLQQLELLGLDEKGETQGPRDTNTLEALAAPRRSGQVLAYLQAMTVVKKV